MAVHLSPAFRWVFNNVVNDQLFNLLLIIQGRPNRGYCDDWRMPTPV